MSNSSDDGTMAKIAYTTAGIGVGALGGSMGGAKAGAAIGFALGGPVGMLIGINAGAMVGLAVGAQAGGKNPAGTMFGAFTQVGDSVDKSNN